MKVGLMPEEGSEEIRQRRRHSIKWNNYPNDTIPLWVADMDLFAPTSVTSVLSEAIRRSDLGYPSKELYDSYLDAINRWTKRRFGYLYERENLEPIGDIVQAIYWAVSTLPGNAVIFASPAYPPFFRSVRESKKDIVTTEMQQIDGVFRIDIDDLEEKALHNRGSILLLCNPHNPTGRVLEEEELKEITDVAMENGLWIISDEIHRDIVFDGHRHIPTASISPQVAQRTVSLISGSKTFNLAGLHAAALHIPSGTPSELMRSIPKGLLSGPSSLGLLAGATAFENEEAWLSQTLNYIDDNRKLLAEFAGEYDLRATIPQGTYMSWIDFAPQLQSSQAESAHRLLLDRARLALSSGEEFLPQGGTPYARMNLATSHQVLKESLDRLKPLLHT